MVRDDDRVWVVTARTETEWPDLGKAFEVLAADTEWCLLRGLYGDIDRKIAGYAHLRIAVPKAGKWIDLGGQEIYLDDDLDVVEDAAAVLKSLNVELDGDDPDDQLRRMDRVF